MPINSSDNRVATPATIAVRWRLLADRPPAGVCAMIRASDEDGSWLLPGPVYWDEIRLCWIDDTTDEPVRMPAKLCRKGVRYHWADEQDLCMEAA